MVLPPGCATVKWCKRRILRENFTRKSHDNIIFHIHPVYIIVTCTRYAVYARYTWKVYVVVGVPAGKKQKKNTQSTNCETKETRWGHLLFETRTHVTSGYHHHDHRPNTQYYIVVTSGHRKTVSDSWNPKKDR